MPSALLLARHGESAGNLARDRALAENLQFIDIAQRDCDVALSERGEEQARALGRWLGASGEVPDAIVASPYVRAQQTAQIARQAGGWTTGVRIDERFREKEFGMLDRLTRSGIMARFPEQSAMRERLGKFYYRPPGGESWADVVLRLRSAFASLQQEYARGRVLIISHQVVVLCMRYIIEDLTEPQILAIDNASEVANCSLTTYVHDARAPHRLRLLRYNETAPLEEQGASVTAEPDVPVGPK